MNCKTCGGAPLDSIESIYGTCNACYEFPRSTPRGRLTQPQVWEFGYVDSNSCHSVGYTLSLDRGAVVEDRGSCVVSGVVHRLARLATGQCVALSADCDLVSCRPDQLTIPDQKGTPKIRIKKSRGKEVAK